MKDKDAAEVARAFGDPMRLSIYKQISHNEELCCGDICDTHSVTPPTVSHHLKVLSELGLIKSRRERSMIYYRIVPERLVAYISYLAALKRP